MTHYCVVRADLPFGAQAAQLIHATGQSLTEQHPRSTYAIALHAHDEADLRELSARLSEAKIANVLVVEEDPPYAGQAMALGILPMDRKRLKPFLSSYAACSSVRQSSWSNDPAGPGFKSLRARQLNVGRSGG